MKKLKIKLLILITLLISTLVTAQDITGDSSSYVNVNQLPEYIVITSEGTKFLGGININIDHKNSDYKDALGNLEKELQSGSKLAIRNQTDLLNQLSKIGFEYVDAFNANAGASGVGVGDNAAVGAGKAKYRTNMIFRKKSKYRN